MKHYGILFNKSTGKTLKIIQQEFGDTMLKLLVSYGFVQSSQNYVIFNDIGTITGYYEGTKHEPKNQKDFIGKHIETIGFSVKEIM